MINYDEFVSKIESHIGAKHLRVAKQLRKSVNNDQQKKISLSLPPVLSTMLDQITIDLGTSKVDAIAGMILSAYYHGYPDSHLFDDKTDKSQPEKGPQASPVNDDHAGQVEKIREKYTVSNDCPEYLKIFCGNKIIKAASDWGIAFDQKLDDFLQQVADKNATENALNQSWVLGKLAKAKSLPAGADIAAHADLSEPGDNSQPDQDDDDDLPF